MLDSRLWQYIKFNQWEYLTEDQIIRVIRKHLPHSLKTVDLSDCRVTSLVLRELTTRFEKLETLLLQNTTFMRDEDGDEPDENDEQLHLGTQHQSSTSFVLPSQLIRLDLRHFEPDSKTLLPHVMVQVSDIKSLECLRCSGVTVLQVWCFYTVCLCSAHSLNFSGRSRHDT